MSQSHRQPSFRRPIYRKRYDVYHSLFNIVVKNFITVFSFVIVKASRLQVKSPLMYIKNKVLLLSFLVSVILVVQISIRPFWKGRGGG